MPEGEHVSEVRWGGGESMHDVFERVGAWLAPALLEQLADGGRMVIPVGNDREQQLLRITRRGDRYEREVLGPVVFVPLLQGLA